MKSDRVIESAIRAAQNLLWQNLPPTYNLPDAAAVALGVFAQNFSESVKC
jgi:hypothetical protein